MIYGGAALFAVLTAFFGALTPANKAANISPIEALKYTGIERRIKTVKIRTNVNGKPHRMAIRNIFRDRKRAAVVLLSLFLGITVFTSVMTIIGSMDIEHRIQNEYEYDFTIMPKGGFLTLDDGFVQSAKELDGVADAGITLLGSAELVYSEALEHIFDFSGEGIPFVIRGIDPVAFANINKALPVPIEKDAFERGEIALVNTLNHCTDENVAGALTQGSVLRVKSGEREIPVTIGGESSDLSLRSGVSLGFGEYHEMELIISNAFFPRVYSEAAQGGRGALLVRLDMNVRDGFDEQVFNALTDIMNPAEAAMTSRYEARKAMQDAQTIMYVLGGGISAILGVIGIFNFINVMSVGVMARKRELAMLESIGMTKKQVRLMLRSEGFGYAIITIICVLTFGSFITYSLFSLFKNMAEYATFTYPFIPCVSVFAAILAICLITSEIVYKGISKITLVERLREVE